MESHALYKFFPTSKEALEAMYEQICAARSSIYWETYIFQNDTVGKRFIEMLKEKARRGVEIKLILDGFGSFWMENRILREMSENGIEILRFNPLKLSAFWRGMRRVFERTHRKLLIIDQETAFIGGVNVNAETQEWLDLQIRVKGPIVKRLLRSFSHSYLAGGGVLDKIKHILYLPIIKEKYWRVLWHKPQEKFSIVRKLYLQAINRAKKTLTLVSPYFLPDQEFLKALREARKRGVDVQLILPLKTDHPILTYAMRAYWKLYDRLGFKIHLVKKMIHAKAMMVDDKWAMVGSSNFDPQTFYRSHEANLIFTKKEMLEDLKKIFVAWKGHSKLFHISKWEKRSWVGRVYEAVCKLLRPIL